MSDQVNSTRLVTNESGDEVYSAAHGPFGKLQKIWENEMEPNPKFSGKEREKESGIDYFGARYYDHLAYRFLSVDPVMNRDEAMSNPQLWNLYAYCRNNPITFLDPDGRTELTFYIKEGILLVDPQVKGRAPYRVSATSGRGKYMNDPDKKIPVTVVKGE